VEKFATQYWDASWITHSSSRLKDYEVFHFRNSFDLERVPGSFHVHVSADSRYKLYVNGQLVGLGPARSDLSHWNFDTYDLAEFLRRGKNTIAALVWNQGEHNALAQHSYRTAFIMEGVDAADALVSTPGAWRVNRNESYHPIIFKPVDPRLFWQYYVAGALDSLNASSYPWHWEQIEHDDALWDRPVVLGKGTPAGKENHTRWDLVPRTVGYLERTTKRFVQLRFTSGISPPASFPSKVGNVIHIPAYTRVTMLLDAAVESTGYPRLTVSGGKNSVIKIGYAETLLDIEKDNPFRWHKTDRDKVDGKKFVGVYDVYLADGGSSRTFTPLWMRTFRYVRLDITTQAEELTINDIDFEQVMYPFASDAKFVSNDSVHQKIFEACLLTIRTASQETYLDPYYEQMQYIGDTRIQALYGYYHFRDDRLSRSAIEQFQWSQNSDGLTMSRYPSDLPQYTPLFSLCWILMINDYWSLRGDDLFVKQFLPGVVRVLEWFETHRNNEGMFGGLPYLDFLDSHYDRNGTLERSASGSLMPYSLFYVYTVTKMKPLFSHFGKTADLDRFIATADQIRREVIENYYDVEKRLFADNKNKTVFSQHGNIMAVLTDCVRDSEKKNFMDRVLHDSTLAPVALYFKFYEFEALKDAGMGARILEELGDWKKMLTNNMHTFSEWLDDPRSDCHSWSAYPGYFFLSTIAGIKPGAPGFESVLIKPDVGNLSNVSAKVPHPSGTIAVSYKKKDFRWDVVINLPDGVHGVLKWRQSSYKLKAGTNSFRL
jgi:hypothetical protein